MPRPLKLLICGAAGRMGRETADLVSNDPRFTLIAGVDRVAGRTAAGVPIVPLSRISTVLTHIDVSIDFSLPRASVKLASASARFRRRAVIATTGFTPQMERSIRKAAKKTALFIAPNLSPGMNLLFELAARSAAALPDYDAVISETHHTRKKDAPSGSAKRMGDFISAARGSDSAPPTVSLRAGDVIGEHTVLLAGQDERLELTHRAQSRALFARGGLDAALWLARKRPGLYTMRHRLGLQ